MGRHWPWRLWTWHLTCAWVSCKLLASCFPFCPYSDIGNPRKVSSKLRVLHAKMVKRQTRNWTTSMAMHSDYAWLWTRSRSQVSANLTLCLIFLIITHDLWKILYDFHDFAWSLIFNRTDRHGSTISTFPKSSTTLVESFSASRRREKETTPNYCSSNCLFNVLFLFFTFNDH